MSLRPPLPGEGPGARSPSLQVRNERMNRDEQLNHICWLGGSPCSGKTTIADQLARRYGCQVYQCDEAFDTHKAGIPAMQPILRMSWDEIWMRPLGEQLRDQFAIYGQEFAMIEDDLRALPRDRPIIAEGTALLPAMVAQVADMRQALWLVPSPAFQRERYPRRGEWVQAVLSECSDPAQAFENWMARDSAYAQEVAAQAARHGARVIVVDGSQPLDQVAAQVEQNFETLLAKAF